MKHSIFIISITSLILTSCAQDTRTEDLPTTRPDFFIQTQELSRFTSTLTRETTTTIDAGSTLSLDAESSGKVKKIHFNEWQFVKAGSVIVSLEDSMNNFDIVVAQARNSLALQQASAETSRVNLDNAVVSAQMTYDRAKLAYDTLMNKTDLQYDSLVKKNRDTLASHDDSYRNFLVEADRSMTQYLNEGDKIIGASLTYEWLNERWEPYLGAYAGNSFKEATDAWNALYTMRWEVRKRLADETTFTASDVHADIDIIVRANEHSRKFADAMLHMLQNSPSNDYLTEAMKSGWTQAWNGYRSAISGAESQFLSWKTPVNTFLNNYQNTELATRIAVKWLDQALSSTEFNAIQENNDLRLDYKNIQLDLNEAIDNAKMTLDNAEKSLRSAEKIRDATIKQLQASVESARLSLMQAERNASRLSVKAPISGVITKIHAEIGQNINPGVKVAEFAGQDPQSRIEVDPRTALLLQVGDTVTAEIAGQTITGSITAVSSIASANMLSSVRIAFPDANNFIGQAARITLHLPEADDMTGRYLIPINAVSIVAEGEGRIHTYSNGTIKTMTVRLGNMYGKGIEVITDLDPNTKIITNDISAYNESDYTLREEATSTHE